jgi:3-hydroxybutyryl-CoA dehydrogenase
MYIFKAGVVGAGAMGAGIAQVISYSGLPVVLKDVDQKMLDKGMEQIRAIYGGRVEKGKMSAGEMQSKLDLITPALDYGEFADVDIVIEAVPEKMSLKQRIFQELDKVCPEGTIYASNTSALSITEMGRATQRPQKMIGMHFFSPAHVMKLVEIIPGLATSEETLKVVWELALAFGKTPARANDYPGFIANRILLPMINEAVYCLYHGVGTREDIDTVMKLGMNHPMGPLALADLIGLDTCLAIMETLYEGFKDSKYRPCPLLRKYVEAGWLGRKSGRGFYDYR